MNSACAFMLLLLITHFSSFVNISAENVTKINKEELKAADDIQSSQPNNGSSNLISRPSTEEITQKTNGTNQLFPRQRRNVIPGMEDLLSDKHHNDKRSVVVFKQQVLEIQVPDNPEDGNHNHHKHKHSNKHHKNMASGLNFLDSMHPQSSKNKDDMKKDNVEDLNIVIKKTSHEDTFGNKLEKIHPNPNKITASKGPSVNPFQEPIAEYPDEFVYRDPEEISGSNNNFNLDEEHEPHNPELDKNNQIFNSENENYEDIKGNDRFMGPSRDYIPPEIGFGNQFGDANNQLNNFPEPDGRVPDIPFKPSDDNPDNLSPPNRVEFTDKSHNIFPSETRNEYFDDSDKSPVNNFPDNHRQLPDMSFKHSNGNPDTLNPSDNNGFVDKPFHPENGNNIPFENIDKASMQNLENNRNIPETFLKNLNGNPENMMLSEGEMLPHSHVGETVHEMIKKEKEIHEINAQSGNKEVSREISKETSNTISRKVLEDSKSFINPEIMANHLQEIPNESMNYRAGNENLDENHHFNNPMFNNLETFDHVQEVPQNPSSFIKRNDMNELKSQKNLPLNSNSYDNTNHKTFSDSLIPKSISTREENMENIKNFPTLNSNSHDSPTHKALSDSLIPKPISTQEGNVTNIKNFPLDFEKRKNHPIDLGEIKNYPFIDIHKDSRPQDTNNNRKRLFEIFFPHNDQLIPSGREKKQASFQNIEENSAKNFNEFQPERNQFERSYNSAQNAGQYTPTSSSTISSATKKTEKRESVMKQLSDVAIPYNPKNLLYIRKRMVEILLPNGSSKNNGNTAEELQKLPFLENDRNYFSNYHLRNSEQNNPYPPNNQRLSKSKIFENTVPQQSNIPGTSPGYLNFVERDPNSDLLQPSSKELNGYQLNEQSRENVRNLPFAEEEANANIKRREMPVNAENIVNQLLGMSSNQFKRNTLPSGNSLEPMKSKRKKKSYKSHHLKRRHTKKQATHLI